MLVYWFCFKGANFNVNCMIHNLLLLSTSYLLKSFHVMVRIDHHNMLQANLSVYGALTDIY